MRKTEPVIEDSGVVEDVHHLRLMALLQELAREKGKRGAARALGIDPRTVASCMRTGKLSWRVREALERGLQSGAGSAAARQRERNDALERRLEELEGQLRSGLEEVRSDIVGDVSALLDEQTGTLERFERRMARLESAKDAKGVPSAAASDEKPAPAPPWREYRELVTEEAEPGEEGVYGEATPLIVEWRRATAERKRAAATGTALERAEARMRALELEIELIDTRELTLPPDTYPWDRSNRREHLRRRRRSLENARVERRWALLRRWLRRVLTFGLWRN